MAITAGGSQPSGRLGDHYLTELWATGGTLPYRWTIVRGTAPPGLSLDESGKISGVPRVAGMSTFVVQITDAAGVTAEQAVSILIDPADGESQSKNAPANPSAKSGTPSHSTVSGNLTLGWLTLAAGAIIFGIVVVSSSKVSNLSLLLAVALIGGAGGCLSAVAAVSSYVMNRSFRASWAAYFAFRPLIGAGLSTLVYFAIRAGIVGSDAPVSSVNHYGILVVSFAAGLFSKNALDKLFEINDIIYSRSSGFVSAVDQRRRLPPPVRELDAYRGFIVYQFKRDSASLSWLLQLWLQSSDSRDLRSYELNVGEGPAANTVRFRFTVFQHDYQSVTPQSATIEARNDEERSGPISFRFDGAGGGEHPPTALIEVSQHGRTVAVVSANDSHA